MGLYNSMSENNQMDLLFERNVGNLPANSTLNISITDKIDISKYFAVFLDVYIYVPSGAYATAKSHGWNKLMFTKTFWGSEDTYWCGLPLGMGGYSGVVRCIIANGKISLIDGQIINGFGYNVGDAYVRLYGIN